MNKLYMINNITYDDVSKQLENKLQTSSDVKQSKENSYQKIRKQCHFCPRTNEKFIDDLVTQQTSQDHANTSSPIQNNTINEQKSTISMNHSSTLDDLLNQLNTCQENQAILIKKIQELTSQSKQISSLTFFLPFNSIDHSQTNLSLQDAFQQRKSSFIERSNKRIKQISSQKNLFHQRIIPNIKQTNNTYLQERQKFEYDRLCAMIIKHQNRKNAKIYGNLIKNQICHH